MIKTKPATNDYRDNFDKIFNQQKVTMKRYRIPVDVFVMAKDEEAAERRVTGFLRQSNMDAGPQFNIAGYEFPVGYPVEPDILGEIVKT